MFDQMLASVVLVLFGILAFAFAWFTRKSLSLKYAVAYSTSGIVFLAWGIILLVGWF